ncbi:16S rRNA (cytidine(1402)-2'-O)-methyltransferase [Agrococcus casei]|uniref:Ribosomal RNA small subunit methyltransferase I n=1 Tax=Agrococcus casei LMG 22410 TaxID=1255656 RepID=A0A1R4EW63_9MICO|nr:16S rRNA (cytidine(1402)-2'-O)-methyltransferase [Agrococcus casei]SJM47892.1 rRNA small subunit methyltransferase I [Agrococcus casei LMG 22410]
MIILGATPIGNLGDATPRLIDALNTVKIIAAEDTRTAIRLMRALDVDAHPELIALHEHNERVVAADLVGRAAEEDVLVLTDAGMPTVSDPGFVLVREAVAQGVDVTCLPGPSAVVVALAVSGLPTDRFAFDGFLPRKKGQRLEYFASLAAEPRTVVVFESPHRIASTVADIAEALPDRQIAVCRELTKKFEEVRRGTAGELLEWASGEVRGEIVIVIAPGEQRVRSFDEAATDVRALVADGTRLRDAAAVVAQSTGFSKRDLYEAGLGRS